MYIKRSLFLLLLLLCTSQAVCHNAKFDAKLHDLDAMLEVLGKEELNLSQKWTLVEIHEPSPKQSSDCIRLVKSLATLIERKFLLIHKYSVKLARFHIQREYKDLDEDPDLNFPTDELADEIERHLLARGNATAHLLTSAEWKTLVRLVDFCVGKFPEGNVPSKLTLAALKADSYYQSMLKMDWLNKLNRSDPESYFSQQINAKHRWYFDRRLGTCIDDNASVKSREFYKESHEAPSLLKANETIEDLLLRLPDEIREFEIPEGVYLASLVLGGYDILKEIAPKTVSLDLREMRSYDKYKEAFDDITKALQVDGSEVLDLAKLLKETPLLD